MLTRGKNLRSQTSISNLLIDGDGLYVLIATVPTGRSRSTYQI